MPVGGKIANLRIVDDDAGVMNRSVLDAGGEVLVVSQFTLYGDTSRGRRPSWIAAARPDKPTLAARAASRPPSTHPICRKRSPSFNPVMPTASKCGLSRRTKRSTGGVYRATESIVHPRRSIVDFLV